MRELDERLKSGNKSPTIVFVVDEIIELMRIDEHAAGGALGRLAQLGRERGIHLILATQRPDRRYMDRLSVANLGLRLVGRVADSVESTLACGIGGVGAHRLCGPGDFLGVVSGGVQRIAIALVDDGDLAKLPATENPPEMPNIKDIDIEAMLGEGLKSNGGAFTSKEYAVAATGIGIGKLKQVLGVGQPRATRLRQEWAIPMLEELSVLGYGVQKVSK